MAQETVSAVREETIAGSGGALFMRSWKPAGTPRAVVLVVPGFNSHSGYYLWTGEQLTANGFAVYAIDLRGRGKSDGERFYVDSMDDYVRDVAAMAAIARSREPGLATFVLGHSAGGVVSSSYTLEHQSEMAGLICESFAFQVPAPDAALQVLKGISHIAPHAHVLKLKNEDFSRDPQVVAAMNADPLIADESQPSQTIAAMVRANEHLKKAFPTIHCPVFIMHGTLDKATVPAGSQFFYDTTGSTDKTLKLYDGHFHDLLNDVGRETVMADIVAWLNARLTR